MPCWCFQKSRCRNWLFLLVSCVSLRVLTSLSFDTNTTVWFFHPQFHQSSFIFTAFCETAVVFLLALVSVCVCFYESEGTLARADVCRRPTAPPSDSDVTDCSSDSPHFLSAPPWLPLGASVTLVVLANDSLWEVTFFFFSAGPKWAGGVKEEEGEEEEWRRGRRKRRWGSERVLVKGRKQRTLLPVQSRWAELIQIFVLVWLENRRSATVWESKEGETVKSEIKAGDVFSSVSLLWLHRLVTFDHSLMF